MKICDYAGLTRLWIAIILISAATAIAGIADYKLDLAGPVHVTELPRPVPLPTRVDVYVTGPRVYVDKSDTPWSLENKAPDCSLTNETEIDKLISVLQENDNKERVTNVTKRKGYTFHLLLFDEGNKTVMHFRVFKTTEFATPWCDVDPRSDIGFGYFNDKIGSWLVLHMTNVPKVQQLMKESAAETDLPKTRP